MSYKNTSCCHQAPVNINLVNSGSGGATSTPDISTVALSADNCNYIHTAGGVPTSIPNADQHTTVSDEIPNTQIIVTPATFASGTLDDAIIEASMSITNPSNCRNMIVLEMVHSPEMSIQSVGNPGIETVLQTRIFRDVDGGGNLPIPWGIHQIALTATGTQFAPNYGANNQFYQHTLAPGATLTIDYDVSLRIIDDSYINALIGIQGSLIGWTI
jgi:hypothetical protein